MHKNKKLGSSGLAAILATAVLCLSQRVPAEPAGGVLSFESGAHLANPHPDQDDDSTDDASDPSGDATLEPEPQPVS